MEPFVREQQRGEEPQLLKLQGWMNQIPGLSAGFSTRHGGTSKGEWNSLNCALHVRDREADVIRNRELIAEELGLPFETWTCAEQVHGNRVHIVTNAERGAGRLSRESAIQSADSLITNEPGIWLTAFYADCVPLYFVDPVKRAIGLAHAGWKGTVMEIAAETVKAMEYTYECRPEDILASIGPSIGVCCYEVDEKVMERVKPIYGQQADPEEAKKAYSSLDNGKYMLDLKEINRHIMIKAGILPMNIELSEWCTSCHTDLFFSHRKEQGATGRMVSWIGFEKR